MSETAETHPSVASGHRMTFTLDDETIYARVICPHDGVDVTALAEADVPDCRIDYSEDHEPVGRLPYCNVNEWASNCSMEEYLHVRPAVLLADLPIAFWWENDGIMIAPQSEPSP